MKGVVSGDFAPKGRRTCRWARRCAKRRNAEEIIAGLPAHVMDELVEDLAEAVVAVLLSQATSETDEHGDASSNLRTL